MSSRHSDAHDGDVRGMVMMMRHTFVLAGCYTSTVNLHESLLPTVDLCNGIKIQVTLLIPSRINIKMCLRQHFSSNWVKLSLEAFVFMRINAAHALVYGRFPQQSGMFELAVWQLHELWNVCMQ